MKRSTKAVLLSALVLPGIGHIYLKKHLAGALLVLGAVIALYVLTAFIVHTAFDVAQQIETGKVGLDAVAIGESLGKHTSGSEQTMSIATNAFIILWIVGIIDSYRVGLQQDKIAQGKSEYRQN